MGGLKTIQLKLGDGIQCLALTVDGKLPPISGRGLKCLRLFVWGRLKHEPFEEHPCDLSYLTHLEIYFSSVAEQLLIMEAYNIGENLEFLSLGSEPSYEVFLRTHKLKDLTMIGFSHFLLKFVCPILHKVYYGPNHWYKDEKWQENMYDLESRGITVLEADDVYHRLMFYPCSWEDMKVCFACEENHT